MDAGVPRLAFAGLPPTFRHVSVRAARAERVRRGLRRVAAFPPGRWVEVRCDGRLQWVPEGRVRGLMLDQLELFDPRK